MNGSAGTPRPRLALPSLMVAVPRRTLPKRIKSPCISARNFSCEVGAQRAGALMDNLNDSPSRIETMNLMYLLPLLLVRGEGRGGESFSFTFARGFMERGKKLLFRHNCVTNRYDVRT